jgi:glycosyltransferase involved in cell wall biosynthesis
MVRQWQSNEMEQALKDIKRRETFDLVWAERPCMGELVRSAGFSKLVVDVDDMESVSLRRALKYSSWYRSKPLHYAELAKLYAYEALLPRRFWRLVVCKEEDKRLFGSDRTNVFVVPNGVPVLAPARPETERPGEMLFVGTLSYHPNVDAVEFFHQSILPQVRRLCPDAHLTVVGKEPEPAILALHDGSSCIVRGQVQDVAPHFARAALVVAPIRLGSGTRIKVLEALVRGKAVVATSTAVEGLDLRPGVDLEIADTAEAFALACVRLLGDPVARQRLGIAGRERVLQRYLWDAIGESVECVIRDYADSPAACTAETAP